MQENDNTMEAKIEFKNDTVLLIVDSA